MYDPIEQILFKIRPLITSSQIQQLNASSRLHCFPFNQLRLLRSHHLTGTFHFQSFSSSPSSLLSSSKNLKSIKQIYASTILSNGHNQPLSFPPKFVALYSQFNGNAVSISKTLKEPTIALQWNLALKTHVDSGFPVETLVLYKQMRRLGIEHDGFTFPILNRALLCLDTDVTLGNMVHCSGLKMGFGLDLHFCNTIIEVYSKFDCVFLSRKVFDEMSHRDLVSWTSMISGFVSEGDAIAAFQLFGEMRLEMEPNSVTLIVIFRGCCVCESLVAGKQLHCFVTKNGLLFDLSVQNSTLKMYTKMCCVEDVETFFSGICKRDVVSWNILIDFYSSRGDYSSVFLHFSKICSEGIVSSETLTIVISMLALLENLREGGKLHCLSVKLGLCDNFLLTSLLDFYAKCGELRNSVELFRQMTYRSTITWNAMMSGFIRNGCFKETIWLFQQLGSLNPGAEVLGSLVDACSYMGLLQFGKAIHGHLLRRLFYLPEGDTTNLRTTLMNMYIRCGSISAARTCFNQIGVKDIVSWTSMLEGYGIHGFCFEALNLFNQMLEEGTKPNSLTFLSLLSSCSHSGFVSEGCKFFVRMKWFYGIEPNLDHYCSLVDLLGRSGQLKEALAMIMKMVVDADSRIWGALVAACRVHGYWKIGEFAAGKLLELECDNVGYYTLLSNMQASVGQWSEAEEVRKVVHKKDLKKAPGWSYIEDKGMHHCFVAGDRLHEQAEEIYETLGCLNKNMQEFA